MVGSQLANFLRGFKKMEVSASFADISRYLFPQRFHRGKLDLMAQTL
jgi:hypothetical protein